MKRIIIILLVICTLTLSLISCKHEHEWSNWQTEQSATVLTDGSEFRTCECGEREIRTIEKIGVENALSGKWKYAEPPSDSILYRYLSFSGQCVRYGTNLFGSDIENGTWNCTYKVDGNKLILTSEDGQIFDFTIQDLGNALRIFDPAGHEYIYTK